MLKKLSIVLSFVLIAFILIGCSSDYEDMSYDDYDNQNEVLLADSAPERKIIYKIDASFDVKNLSNVSDDLHQMIESDEWFDQEEINDYGHSYVIRVKTERLDAFIDDLKDAYQVRTYQKSATDVSLAYQDITNQIAALNAQLDRLLVLYDEASLSDMIQINEQISNIEVELQSLTGSINAYDSLIDYSEVTLNFYGSTVTTNAPFFNRVANGFIDGLSALLSFLDGFLIVIVTIFPFLVLFGGIGYGGYVIYKKRKHKKAIK